MFLKRMENAWRCVRSALRPTNLPIHCRPNQPGNEIRWPSYGTTQRTVFSLCPWTRPQETPEGVGLADYSTSRWVVGR